MGASSARALLVGLAGVLAIGILVVAWFTTRVASAPPPDQVGAAAADAAATAAAESASAMSSQPVAPPMAQRILASDSARLEGVVFSALDTPLAGWWVCLWESDRSQFRHPPVEGHALSTRTDAEGRFRFASVRPGRYPVALFGNLDNAQMVQLAAGETREVELRLRGCILELVLRRRGEWVTDLSVELIASDGTRVPPWRMENAGAWRCVVPAGTYGVEVFDAHGAIVCSGRRVVVLPDQGLASVTIDVASAWLETIVDDGSTLPIPALSFEVKGSTLAGDPATYFLGSADGRSAVGEVPPGSWTVTVHSPRVLAARPQTIEIAEGQPHARAVFKAERCGFARLTLRTLDGQPFLHYPTNPVYALMPAQSDRGGETPCVELAQWLGRVEPTPGLVNLPGGMTTFRWVDRVTDGEVVHLPFDPPPPLTLEVLIEGENPLELRVEPRALVQLTACDWNGGEYPQARIGVFAGARRVRPVPQSRTSRWKAFLPPGEYRAVVAYPDETREHLIQVARSRLELRLKQ